MNIKQILLKSCISRLKEAMKPDKVYSLEELFWVQYNYTKWLSKWMNSLTTMNRPWLWRPSSDTANAWPPLYTITTCFRRREYQWQWLRNWRNYGSYFNHGALNNIVLILHTQKQWCHFCLILTKLCWYISILTFPTVIIFILCV